MPKKEVYGKNNVERRCWAMQRRGQDVESDVTFQEPLALLEANLFAPAALNVSEHQEGGES